MRLQYMQTQVEEAQAALARKHLQQQELQERADKAETALLENKQKLYNAEMEIKSLKVVVETETKKRKQTEMELQHTQINLKKTSLILLATQTTESSLTSEALAVINTLEKVIGERNELHSLVTSQINKETSQKVATKEFQEASLVLLNAIESSLTALCRNIEMQQKSGVEAANLNHQVGRQFAAETQKLVNDIVHNVLSATDLMSAQLMGERGINSSVEGSAKSIHSAVEATQSTFSQGEESMDQSCALLKKRCDEARAAVLERAEMIQSSTTETLTSFEAKIMESKDAMLSMVMRLKGSLSQLSDSKNEKTNALNALLEQWKDHSLENSKTVTDITSSSSSSLQASASHFKKELCHHDTVSKMLESQRVFVNSNVAAHVEGISQQSTSLLAHRDMITTYADTQTKLCDEVMKSIMSTVQNIVKSEFGKLATSQKKNLEAIGSDGAKLAEANNQIQQSALQVMHNIQSTNKSLTDESSILLNNDLQASKALHTAQESFVRISDLSNKQSQLSGEYSTNSMKHVSEIKHIDSQNTHIAQMVERDGNACSKSLTNAVLKPTKSEIKKTAKSSIETLAHIDNDVLQRANAVLGEIANKRKELATGINDKLQAVDIEMTTLKENVASIAKSQDVTAGKLSNDVISSCSTLQQSSAPYFIAELDTSKENLVSTITSMSQSVISTITENKAQGAAVKEAVEDFSQNKIQCNKPTPPAPEKKHCKYSTKLSSTPAEEIILKGHIFNPTPAERDDSAYPSEVACKPTDDQEDADISQDTNDDDNKSTMSSGSYSSYIPSPGGLKSRDINVSHGELPPSMKSRNHSKLSINTAGPTKKNKIPSGLRTPSDSSQSRKRMRK